MTGNEDINNGEQIFFKFVFWVILLVVIFDPVTVNQDVATMFFPDKFK